MERPPSQTPLQRKLAQEIADHLVTEGLKAGDRINQLALARKFNVSRSPVRAVLEELRKAGILELQAGTLQVSDLTKAKNLLRDPSPDRTEVIMTAIARDRHLKVLPTDVSENDLMRRYEATRPDVLAALRRMAELGLTQRKPGFGWRFVEQISSPQERHESYRFRMLVEPAALLEPGYTPDTQWLKEMKTQHLGYASKEWHAEMAVSFFEMNASFHLKLTEFSGNRYFIQAIEHQTNLRRLRNYSWGLDHHRVRQSCADHIQVLDALLNGDQKAASKALHRHISSTMVIVK